MSKQYYTYMMTNITNTVIYTGVTNDLHKRLHEHRSGSCTFTKKYHVNKLVYYEPFSTPHDAISREKPIKAGPRKRKEELIDSMNPKWEDVKLD